MSCSTEAAVGGYAGAVLEEEERGSGPAGLWLRRRGAAMLAWMGPAAVEEESAVRRRRLFRLVDRSLRGPHT